MSGFSTSAVNGRSQKKEAGIMVIVTLALTQKDEVKLVHIH